MGKTEIIDKSSLKPCSKCQQNGCEACTGGQYKEESYIVVAKQPNGQQIAFQSEFMGK